MRGEKRGEGWERDAWHVKYALRPMPGARAKGRLAPTPTRKVAIAEVPAVTMTRSRRRSCVHAT